jgi:histidinol-phosphate aminotransferase
MPRRSALHFSRRSFLQFSAAAAAMQFVSEPMLAAAARRAAIPKDAVKIDSNENPLGPSQGARDALIAVVPQGGRYSFELVDDFVDAFAQFEGLNPEFVRSFPGSSPALHAGVMAFTSPQKSYVTADPGYEAGLFSAAAAKAHVVKVPVTKSYAHDVKAMIAAAPDAGLFYVCSPNNPTGTLTSHADIEYLVENKPKDSVVMIDEAYIHFCDAPPTLDLVKAGRDVIVLRTFSKIYGMAGLRCGVAIARPDILDKIMDAGGWNFNPITALAAATASLRDSTLVPERRRINTEVRQQTLQWLDHNDYSYIPSEANFFMLDVKRPGKEVIDAMAKQKVLIGRVWPAMPTCVRITVGTQEEMDRFQSALQKVMRNAAMFPPPAPQSARNIRRNRAPWLC